MRKFTIISLIALLSAINLFAQNSTEKTVYRRSSLYPLLLEIKPAFSDQADSILNNMVMESYGKAPFPEKYNDHRLANVSFKFKNYADIDATKEAKENHENGNDKERKIDIKYNIAIQKYLEENNVARGMVAKWFNRQEDGSFDMSLIHERGSYNASEMEVQLASGSIRGMSAIKDAGEELIKNTFLVVNKMRFVKNEPIARATRDIAIRLAKEIPNAIASQVAIKAAEIAYNAAKDGYSVWTASYLYQLEWNDAIANNFYMNMWMGPTSIDENRKALFDSTNIFKLNYLGFEKAKSLVLIGAGKKTEDILQVATIRNIDRVYTKLQKEYDVFKTKTPIFSTDPVIAKIGLKEGLEKNDKFDVLEMVLDPETGLTKYEKVDQVKVHKGEIWDNRYNMEIEDNSNQEEIQGTKFKGGGKKVMSGMLLRQVK